MEAPSDVIRDAAIVEGVKDIAFGSIAGMVSKVFEHPFDLCKVRLQAQVLDETARFNGPMDCLMTTWRKEGLRGLYRGLPAPVVGAMAENATLFLVYGQLQRLCRWWSGAALNEFSTGQLMFSAAGAGAVTSFVLTPIELVKCKMQVQLLAQEASNPAVALQQLESAGAGAAILGAASPGHPKKPNFSALPGPISVLRTVLRTHGLRGLWLGQTGTLIRETGGAVAWFGTKEGVCEFLLRRRARLQGPLDQTERKLTSKDLHAWESAVAGAFAGVSYNVVLFPADSVKSALQTAEELRPANGHSKAGAAGKTLHVPSPTFWGTAREMYASKGIRGLYAGMGITTARAIPSSAMIFLIYDGLSKRFG
ncbi:mitochondrial carrier [Fomitiporia mediterranea MF3/22]|uniref:mitochondrial carrier n=1 Tax=Fomitiporia mediterranea (strain MF3/22) TaxID=694068 RepID=UPI00044081F9|nr:mitochondrial carrier [Fomitiporia mediterranea MF3/22]EJD05397.1 mitochondrial carrier [Fomitiporia mediterranea MF3/22]